MKKIDSRGFSAIEILLVLIIVGAVGFVGLRLYSTKSSKKESDQQQSQETSQVSSKLKFDNEAAKSDPIGDPRGPFYHDLYYAASSDGITFSGSKKIIEHASVPDVVKLPDGKIAIYAVDAASRSMAGLLVGLSDDNGSTWQFGSLQVRDNGNLGADPEAVVLPDGKVRIYYVEFGGGPAQNGMPASGVKNKVLSAISSDGITFTKEEGTRFEYDRLTDPDVVKIGDTWFMYVSQGPKSIVATSDDGLDFTYKKDIRDTGSVSNTLLVDNGKYRQFYCMNGGIKSALTTNGLDFSDESGDRLDDSPSGYAMVCDPAPIKVDNGWLMIYKAAKQ